MKATIVNTPVPRTFQPFELKLHVRTEDEARALLCVFGCNMVAGKAVQEVATQYTSRMYGRIGTLISGVYDPLLKACADAGMEVK